MMFVDLGELDSLFRRRWFWSTQRRALAWLRRKDYLGDPNVSLDQAVRDRVTAETGARPTGPIRMLTHLRYFGVGFNPVTFYYCYDAADTKIETIVAEITNTPWNERHAYVLPQHLNTAPGGARRFVFAKQFHVSPFMEMKFDYDWRFSPPGERLAVHMENLRNGEKSFDATLDLKRRDIDGWALAKVLLVFPCMTLAVIGGIYWQALRLRLKRVPFHSHPRAAERRPANLQPKFHNR